MPSTSSPHGVNNRRVLAPGGDKENINDAGLAAGQSVHMKDKYTEA
jgi:hypothetical protein